MSIAPFIVLSNLFPIPLIFVITGLLFMAGMASVNYLFPGDRS
jgi:uncharacterized membrane protein YccC